MTTTATGRTPTRLSLDIDGAVASITLRNPPVNVIDIAMMEQLSQTLAELESQARLSVIVFKSEGRAFSAGVDIAAHTPDKVEEMLSKFHAVIRALLATKKITIVSVHGLCLGGAAELVPKSHRS